MEEFCKLESLDIAESRTNVSRLQKRLGNGRDPALLGELIDFYFATGSKRALKVLTTLKSVQSHDFFDKLNECIQRRSSRLAVLRLIAHALNTQTSWLYKVIDHPLFHSILHYLKDNKDVVVLTSALFVVTAILPLVPSYISSHLPDLFEIFAQLATIRQTNRLGLTPKELYLNLDVAVYYFFLQLYAMFPCSLFNHLHARYGPTGEVHEFQEYIAPLFNHVQLHPGLVTDGHSYETSRAKWGAMEPQEILTLGYSMCLDPRITALAVDTAQEAPPQRELYQPEVSLLCLGETDTKLSMKHVPEFGKTPGILVECSTGSNSSNTSRKTSTIEPPTLTQLHTPEAPPNPAGLKQTQELAEFWSPSIAFGQVTPSDMSRQPSRMSVVSRTSPISDSANSSAQHTPGPTANSSAQHTPGPTSTATFTFKNYSPTASVDNDHQVSQSAVHTPSCLEESLGSMQFDPLSQSMKESSHRSATNSRGSSSPIRMVATAHKSEGQLNQSLKIKFGKFFGMLSPSRKRTTSNDSEEFTEIFMTDAHHLQASKAAFGEKPREALRPELPEEDNVSDGSETHLDDATTPCLDGNDGETRLELKLGVYGDSRRFSHIGAIHHSRQTSDGDSREMNYSSSFPGRSPVRRLTDRSRTSNSESDTAHTVHQVKERLQRLVESTTTISEDQTDSSPNLKRAESTDKCNRHPPPLHALSSDSTATLLASSPPLLFVEHVEGAPKGSRLLMRRVSVCRGVSFSSSETGGRTKEEVETRTNPSPVSLLDQFVIHGEMLHWGKAEDIPLTELEGIDWYFFGGCPHSEEVGVMHNQVALLHSQLLFERHQCVQHARRNRRLLSKARTGTQLAEELLQLRDQVRHQQFVIQSLQEEQQRVASKQHGPTHMEEKLCSENRALLIENARLKDTNTRLTEEIKILQQQNADLTQDLKRYGDHISSLEMERAHLEPELTKASELETEVESLTRELQILGELYRQQKEDALAVLTHGNKQEEWTALCDTLRREKEDAERRIASLQQEVQGAQTHVQELEGLVGRKDREIASLNSSLGLVQAKCHEKIKATEEKYQTMKVVSEQLEGHVMELKGRPIQKRRSHFHRHKQSHHTPSMSLTPSTSANSSPSPLFSLSPAIPLS